MITVIQRVSHAIVRIDTVETAGIGPGVLALLAIEKADTSKQADRLLERILNYRIFADTAEKMNLSLRDIHGELLVVPQFTLAADTDSGNRPSFAAAASPEQGKQLFDYFRQRAAAIFPRTQFGTFGADMRIELVNDGPVTFRLRCS